MLGVKTRHDVFVHGPDGALLLHIEDQKDAVSPAGAKEFRDKIVAAIGSAK